MTRRRIYVICQKDHNNKPAIISDGRGHLLYVFGSHRGKKRAEKLVNELNKDRTNQELHLKEGWIEF